MRRAHTKKKIKKTKRIRRYLVLRINVQAVIVYDRREGYREANQDLIVVVLAGKIETRE